MSKLSNKISLIKEIINKIEYPVLSKMEFKNLLSQINNIWGLMSITPNEIKEFLIKNKIIIQEKVILDDTSSFIYLLPNINIDIFDIASIRSRKSYFSFYSALHIHNLTLQIPKQIYLTLERPSLVQSNSLELVQENIDRAFSKPPRATSNKRFYNNFTINFINAQHQNNIGIVSFRNHYKISDLERTLIDISVRPFYAGGVTQVLEAFENAKDLLNTDKLYEYYSKMNYTYPYHQVIGFYLEKAGYEEKDYLKFLEHKQININFYLTYNILHKEFSDKWKLYYPKGL
ncbi:type IV toxin-antitoxin system AbiEi family antitoxin domain-containing protein [Bergeyella zoohelcum]|uniref:AbiEi antitoxin C-terminal domain-containing protein n=2 Tax=Bergeyella zoohelcum TaxID=1015 RepID=K1LHJ9_9FLAO|nr:hypothetical protein [Bergeyella zoohelcum]EKB54121.1 hypothetical protein HMPREF9699_02104 [Bergeyella zoohelcum ATCC 43767]SUV65532.1 Uncharacterised protein [Bergeyella zoohelcum]VDH06592.1 Uncharacterised protein [Bergeyella zoohelcum]